MLSFNMCGYRWTSKRDAKLDSCLCVWIGDVQSEVFYQLQLHLATSLWISLQPKAGTAQVIPSLYAMSHFIDDAWSSMACRLM